MNRGMQMALVAAILVLALGVAGLAAYVFLQPAGARGTVAKPAEAQNSSDAAGTAAESFFFKTKNFTTDLADKDRLRYADVTVALAMKDQAAVEAAKSAEPQIRDVILSQIRTRVAADLAGPAGKDKLAESLQKALSDLLKAQFKKVYVTDLVIQ